ncbi:hypothetical protein KKG72_09600 [bacterium]|nr:hypothetical protein [bacterium]MBU1993138.1 hypothetical protein [bacterium]
MKYYELMCSIYIKADIALEMCFEIISKYISFSMVKGKLEEIHNKDGFKYYVFGRFMPLEKNKIYKKDSTYSFSIRSPDEALIASLSQLEPTHMMYLNFADAVFVGTALAKFKYIICTACNLSFTTRFVSFFSAIFISSFSSLKM